MTASIDAVPASHHERLNAPRILIPGARESGMLTSFRPSTADLCLRDGTGTMDAAATADRQREGGGAPSQRRSAEERSWKGVGRRLRQWFVMQSVFGWRLRPNPAEVAHLTVAP